MKWELRKKKVDNKCQADKNLSSDLQSNEIWLCYGYPLRPEVRNQMMQWWLSSSGTYIFCITSHASFVTSSPLSRAWSIISACNFASLHCWQTTADNWIPWQFSPQWPPWSSVPQFIMLHMLCCICDWHIGVQKLWEQTLALVHLYQNELEWPIAYNRLEVIKKKVAFNCIQLFPVDLGG